MADDSLAMIQRECRSISRRGFLPDENAARRPAAIPQALARPVRAASGMHDIGLLSQLFPEFKAIGSRVVRDFYQPYYRRRAHAADHSQSRAADRRPERARTLLPACSVRTRRATSCWCWPSCTLTSGSRAAEDHHVSAPVGARHMFDHGCGSRGPMPACHEWRRKFLVVRTPEDVRWRPSGAIPRSEIVPSVRAALRRRRRAAADAAAAC